jgi:hypothetical protein
MRVNSNLILVDQIAESSYFKVIMEVVSLKDKSEVEEIWNLGHQNVAKSIDYSIITSSVILKQHCYSHLGFSQK